MSRDLLAGRPTEVAVLGDFADRAREAGTPARLIDLAALALRVHNHRVQTASTS
jgi:ketopantoate reductase